MKFIILNGYKFPIEDYNYFIGDLLTFDEETGCLRIRKSLKEEVWGVYTGELIDA